MTLTAIAENALPADPTTVTFAQLRSLQAHARINYVHRLVEGLTEEQRKRITHHIYNWGQDRHFFNDFRLHYSNPPAGDWAILRFLAYMQVVHNKPYPDYLT